MKNKVNVIDVITQLFPDIIKSKSEARRRVESGAVYIAPIDINTRELKEDIKTYRVKDASQSFSDESDYYVKVGKKSSDAVIWLFKSAPGNETKEGSYDTKTAEDYKKEKDQ